MPGIVAVMDTEPDNIKAGEAGEETTSMIAENERTQVEHGKEENTKEEHSKEESDKAENSNEKKEKKKPSIIKKMKNVRNSIRRGSKELNGTEAGTAAQNSDPESQARTSPTPSIRSLEMSPRSPLSPSSPSSPVNIDVSQSHKRGHSRSPSDSARTNKDTEDTKGNFLWRRWSTRKEKDQKPDLHTLSESINEENVEQVQEKDSYELPEIPANPLSVMQINTLIGNMQLEDAHLNLLSMRLELQKELEEKGKEDTPVELVKKEKDLNLLYSALRDKMKVIVKDSSNQPSCSTEHLICMVQIIQEEEKREGDPGSAGWNWRDTWKEAVREGVRDKIKSVPLDTKEQNTSWLAVHLGLLRKTTMEDLENVKNHLKASYPPSFNVLNTYVESYHESIAQHLKDIPQKDLEAKDCYALLNWIVNYYKSEEMMGSPTLQPDINTDSISLPLEDDFLDQLKKTYCLLIKDDMKTIMGNVIKLQSEDGWIPETDPELEEGFYHSEIHMDILTVQGRIPSVVQHPGRRVSGRQISDRLHQQLHGSESTPGGVQKEQSAGGGADGREARWCGPQSQPDDHRSISWRGQGEKSIRPRLKGIAPLFQAWRVPGSEDSQHIKSPLTCKT
uniref:Exocyst complex component 3-like protein 4 n=1 Tax=Scleropages formosus TaxID=113540 RepID=A0A8C9W580_SCLFO